MPVIEKERFLEVYSRQVDTVYRVCYSFMGNRADTEDLVQETFLRLIASGKEFEDQRHERAWLIVTASNLCRDSLKKWWRYHEDIADYPQLAAEQKPEDDLLEVIFQLPPEYKDAVYLYYYEGYSTVEMAKFLHCPESTVRSRLARARKKLKSLLGGGSK